MILRFCKAKYTHIEEDKGTWVCMLMQTASPALFLISESCVPARHTHILLTHNFDWSQSLTNCNNPVIRSRLCPAFSRLPSQTCAEAQEVIAL